MDTAILKDLWLTDVMIISKPFIPSNVKADFYMFYVFKGQGCLVIDSTSYPANPGCLFLFPAFDIIVPSFSSSKQDSHAILYMAFRSSHILSCELSKLPSVLPLHPAIDRLSWEILHEWTLKKEFYQTAASFLLEQILISAILENKRQKDSLSLLPLSDHSQLISIVPIRDYIDNHLTDDLLLKNLTTFCNMTEKELNLYIKQHTGMSVRQYILHRRLLKSKEFLLFSSLSITEIAELSGFHSVHYFSHVFKSKEGLSPKHYILHCSAISSSEPDFL